MSPPLIFFHSSFDPYLAFTLWQARCSNPGSPIWLIGDDTNDLSAMGVRHFRFADYAQKRDEFVKLYRHFSGHQMENERLCFERWFYLEAVLKETGTEEFFAMDSDVFLLIDLESLPVFRRKDFDIAGGPPWGFGRFVRRGLISEFCDYTLERYRDPAQLADWERRYKAGEDFNPPEGIYNVCDMALWRMFIRDRNLKILDLREPWDGLVVCGGFSSAAGFRMRGKFKEIARENDGYYGFHEKSGAKIRFVLLHFQGKYPKRLQPLFVGWPGPVLRACWRPSYRRNLRKMWLIASYSWRVRKKFFSPVLNQ